MAYVAARDMACGHEVTLAARDNPVKTRDFQSAQFPQVSV